MFFQSCCSLLETLKNFKTTCLESLQVLEELISEKKAEESKYEEDLPLKVEVQSETSDDDDDDEDMEERSSDEEFIPDIKAELKDEEYLEMNEDEDEEDATNKAKRRKRSRKDRLLATGKNCHVCKECGKGFPRPANLRNHFLKKHRGAKHCKYCQKAFEDEDEYNSHMEMEEKRVKMRKETCQKIHVCEVCGLTTRFRSNLVKHMDTQ